MDEGSYAEMEMVQIKVCSHFQRAESQKAQDRDGLFPAFRGRGVDRDFQHGLLSRTEHGFAGGGDGKRFLPGSRIGQRCENGRRRVFRAGRDRDQKDGPGGRGERSCGTFHVHLLMGISENLVSAAFRV